jgi:hypothetical protein
VILGLHWLFLLILLINLLELEVAGLRPDRLALEVYYFSEGPHPQPFSLSLVLLFLHLREQRLDLIKHLS